MEMMKQINTNYIYLLHEREHIRLSEDVYKVGMTRQPNLNRFHNYPKGSILLFQIECIDCKFIESIVLQVFNRKFYNCFFYGNEYFKGDKKCMIDIIHLIISYESQIRERTTDRRKFIEDILKERENMIITPFLILNAQVFSKPHNHLLLGFYCLGRYVKRLKSYPFCKVNSKEFHLTMVQLNPPRYARR